ncbi:DNA translocase FtsK [Pyrinomonas sp.]|uniref:DNA translocase FtsK n=1 Tax=Pyrinomonas sp. TaxID=2080306 RepID=UPI003325B193
MVAPRTSAQNQAWRRTRRNEIIALALFVTGVLLLLCLASFDPNDPSWNTAANRPSRNLVGAIGANVGAALLQILGLTAYLLPLLLFIVGWRRFRTQRWQAPLARVCGLALLVLSISALLALAGFAPIFDRSVEPGGLIGRVIAQFLVSGLNTVGTAVLLIASVAVALLLATNFSFALLYERIARWMRVRLARVTSVADRIREWRERRAQRALERAEARRRARAELEKRGQQTAAERVAEFMRATSPGETKESAPVTPRKAALDSSTETLDLETQTPLPAPPSATKGTPDPQPTAQNAKQPRPVAEPMRERDEERAEAEIEEMLRTAEVVRTEHRDEPVRARMVARATADDYRFPEIDYLNSPPPRHEQKDEELLEIAHRLAEKCREFNVTGQIKHICPGPVVTTYEFKPDPGVKYSRVTSLVDDLCLALRAESIRIDRLPGKPHVGIEVPNPQRETIFLREVIESRQFRESPSKLTIALGKTIDGMNYVADLTKMPHLLIAGATGTGKSVCLNSIVVSILYKARPDEVKFIMIDPKRLELGLYADIPHLATPIITDPKRAANALKWAVSQMEQRYKDLARWGVRNIDGYNAEVERRNDVLDFDENGEPHKPLPYIVIIIDELADLMMVSGHEVEEAITRLAQMARAVGIHLVIATQRPSVDVITGLIKANFPSRISFRVSSKVDSRTILDANGAEQLLGRGDMLFLPPGTSRLVRVHGAYVDETEINKIVAHVKAQATPTYDETITQSEEEAEGEDGLAGFQDELFEDALRICVEMKRASTSVLQRRLRIGYGRAAAILDAMERQGYIGPADGARPRPVLSRAYETVAHWDSLKQEE